MSIARSVKSLLLSGLVALTAGPTVGQSAEDLPAGVEQIIPRGAIPAVLEPRFVGAEEADIADDAWVLGVVVGGKPRAYSLNLLNRHEIVNDQEGEESFAAVW